MDFKGCSLNTKFKEKKRRNHKFPNGFYEKAVQVRKKLKNFLKICAQKVWILRVDSIY